MGTCDIVASRRTAKTARRVSIEQALTRAVDRSAEAYRLNGLPSGVPMGIKSIDRALRGLKSGQFVVIEGRPGMGKSAVAVRAADGAASAGHPVLIFSLEMEAEDLASRMASARCYAPNRSIPYFSIDNGLIDEEQFRRFTAASRAIAALPIDIEPQAGISIGQLASRARRWAQERLPSAPKGLGLIIVDYLQLLKSSDRYAGKRVDEVTEMSTGLKALAKELGIPIIALAQMSRNAEHRDDKRPTLADLRDSGSIEQDADIVVGLYRAHYYLSRKADPSPEEMAELRRVQNVLEIIILKQRKGPTGTYEVFCAMESNHLGDLGGAAEDNTREYQGEMP
jgi:replicative DNA helicase